MASPFVGQIIPVAFTFAPQGWFLCDGSLKPIATYDALYNLIGTTYGGDGQSTFGVPDLRGRAALAFGNRPGFSTYVIGQTVGAESVTLTAGQTASHSHTLNFSANAGNLTVPAAGLAAGTNSQNAVNAYAPKPATTGLASGSITSSSGGQPHENRQPFLVINYIIAWAGTYPSQQ